MKKKDLFALISEKTELKQADVKNVVEAFFTTVVDKIAANERVQIKGFGVFFPVYQARRPVRNPKTGEALDLIPRNNFKFKPGNDIIRKLNKEKEA